MTTSEIVTELSHQLKRWDNGELSNDEIATLVDRANRKLARACYCEQNVCCKVHSNHVTPHQGCILR